MEPYSRKIYYYETDRMSIVHNSNYLRIFEEARLDHLEKSGVDYHEMEANGILIPQTEAYVKYVKPLQYGDEIDVFVDLVQFNGIIMKYEYKMFLKGQTKAAAEGYTCHCFLDDGKRLPVNIRRRMPYVYAALEETKCVADG